MVDIKNKKFGFSLAETLISMLVLSMFFIATSKMITTKPKTEVSENKHGYFECYMDGGTLMQKRSDEGSQGDPVPAPNGVCSFEPPSGIAFANIYVLNSTSGEPRFYIGVEPQFNSQDNSDTVHLTLNDLQTLQNVLEDAGEGNSNIIQLRNFFSSCHASSSIFKLIKNNSDYAGPAAFIGW